FPASYRGLYFFSDFVFGWIHTFNIDTGAVNTFASNLTTGGPVGMLVTPAGDLLYLARGGFSANDSGAVYRISYPGPGDAPDIDQQPAGRLVSAGHPATFSVVASGEGPLVYQWQKNNADIPGATGPTYTLPSAALTDDGARFRAVVRNPFGAAFSNSVALNV